MNAGDTVVVSGIDTIFNGTFSVTGVNTTNSTFSYTVPPFSLTVTKKQLTAGVATLTVSSLGALVAGDFVTINLGDPHFDGTYPVTTVNGAAKTFSYSDTPADNPNAANTYTVASRSLASSGTATLTVTTAPSQTNGDSLIVDTGDPVFDGTYTISAFNAASKTISYVPTVFTSNIASASASGGVITVTTASPHGLPAAGGAIVATGQKGYDGTVTVLASPAPTSTAFSYSAPSIQLMSYAITGNVVTITVKGAGPHGYKVGDSVNVTTSGTGAPTFLNGTFTLLGAPNAPAATKFSYSLTHGNVGNTNFPAGVTATSTLQSSASVAATGTVTVDSTPTLSGSGTAVAGVTVANANVTPNVVISARHGDVAAASTAGTYTVNGTTPWAATSTGGFVVHHSGSMPLPSLYTVTASGAPSPGLNAGTYYGGLCIGVPAGVSCSSANCKTADQYTPVAYSPAQTGSIAATGNTLTITSGGGTPIKVGDYVAIDTGAAIEKMQITGGSGTSWTVNRPLFGTTKAAHTNKAIQYIVGAPDVTLPDGTYIMAGGGFFVCGAAKLTAPHVLIINTSDTDPTSGTTYDALDQIQLDTTGDITLGPPDTGPFQGLSMYQPVTQELSPFTTAPYTPAETLVGGIDNSTTSITVSGTGINTGDLIYIDSEEMRVTAGGGTTSLTVDRGNTLFPGSDTSASHNNNAQIKTVAGAKCDGRQPAQTDILWSSIGNGINGISGSVYAPNGYALFSDSVSGTASIAVMTGCIFINGADSTFSFQPTLLFGNGGIKFLGEWGS
jgi:hypothetical protein